MWTWERVVKNLERKERKERQKADRDEEKTCPCV